MACLNTYKPVNFTTLKSSSFMVYGMETVQIPFSTVQGPSNFISQNNDTNREGRMRADLVAMDDQAILVDANTCSSLLQVCANSNSLITGKQIHAHILIRGLEQNTSLGTKLVNMYAMCGGLEDARLVFDKIYRRNVLLWNAMIRGYAKSGACEETLALYYQMQGLGVQPDNFTFPPILKACAGLSDVHEGKEVHYHIGRCGFDSDVFVATALIDMYAKCGSIEVARQVFDKMSVRDVVSWNAMISGYVHNGWVEEALTLFRQMQPEDVKPNWITMVSVLPAFAHLAALQLGQAIHGYVIRSGFCCHVSVETALVDMYVKCRSTEFARQLFDTMSKRDVVSWNAMIAGYAQNGYAGDALTLFRQMQLANVTPNSATMVSVLPACAYLGALQQGKCFHSQIIVSGIESDVSVGNSLIDMYAKCEDTDVACQLFDKMSHRDVVSWSVMISGYVQNGYVSEAFTLFRQMRLENTKPNSVTMVSVLSGCAHLAALQQGECIHAYIIRSGLDSDVSVETALVTTYAKCGSIEVARQLFDKMSKRDVVLWSALIAGYGMHGYGQDALELFFQMQRTGMKPDHITFVGVLSACSHAGLVDEGWQYFDCMSQDYCITPRVEHYACMVDLLSRAGHLDEAHDLIKKMPVEPDASVWGALLGGCRIHCNIKLGEFVSEQLLKLEPRNAGNYVLLSNIYAVGGRWGDVAKVRAMVKDSGLKKSPGCSWIEIKNRIHAFSIGDRSHPQSEEIYGLLESLTEQMKGAGYVPDVSFVLHDVG